MTITNEPTPTSATPLSDRMLEVDLDGRMGDLPEHLKAAKLNEATINAACDWLEAHPPVPAWLNLDGILPAEAREKIAIALSYVRRNVDVVRETAMAVRMWTWEFEDAAKGLPQDVYAAAEDASGVAELRRIGLAFHELFEAAYQGTSTPDGALEVLDAIEAQLEAEGIEPAQVTPDLYDTARAMQS